MLRFARPLVASVILGSAIYVSALLFSGVASVLGVAQRLSIGGIALVIALSAVNYGVRFMRWHWYLLRLGQHIPWRRHILYYLAGFAFTTTPGKAGEAVRSVYLRRHQIGYAQSLAALFVERLVDLAAIVLLSTTATWALSSTRWPVVIAAFGILGVLALFRHAWLESWLAWLDRHLRVPRASRFLEHLMALLRSSRRLLATQPLFGGLGLGLVAWGAEGLGFGLILMYLETPIPLYAAVGIYSIAVLAGALSFLPGGLGGTEAMMVLLLKLAGVDTASAVASTLICRLATLWLAVLIGLITMFGLEARGHGLGRIPPAERQRRRLDLP